MQTRTRVRRIAAALLLASAGSAHCAEPEPQQDPCNFHSSMPLLERGVYKAHAYTEAEHDEATEIAELSAHARIEIASSGCVDSSVRVYTLTYSGAAPPRHTLAEWAGIARRTLGELRYIKGREDEIREIIAYAGQVAAMHSSATKLVRCSDGSVPADGECAWSTGGGHSIEVRLAQGFVQVIFGEKSSR